MSAIKKLDKGCQAPGNASLAANHTAQKLQDTFPSKSQKHNPGATVMTNQAVLKMTPGSLRLSSNHKQHEGILWMGNSLRLSGAITAEPDGSWFGPRSRVFSIRLAQVMLSASRLEQ